MSQLGRLLARVPEPIWATALFAVTTATAMFWVWTVAPASTDVADVEPADAVVVFVGGQGERTDAAFELMARDVADVLVVPNANGDEWPRDFCSPRDGFEVVCPVPETANTRGEARVIAELAAQREWDRLVLVTSTHHVARARLLLERCFDGDVTAVAADPHLSFGSWLDAAIHEWFGHVHALGVARGC